MSRNKNKKLQRSVKVPKQRVGTNQAAFKLWLESKLVKVSWLKDPSTVTGSAKSEIMVLQHKIGHVADSTTGQFIITTYEHISLIVASIQKSKQLGMQAYGVLVDHHRLNIYPHPPLYPMPMPSHRYKWNISSCHSPPTTANTMPNLLPAHPSPSPGTSHRNSPQMHHLCTSLQQSPTPETSSVSSMPSLHPPIDPTHTCLVGIPH